MGTRGFITGVFFNFFLLFYIICAFSYFVIKDNFKEFLIFFNLYAYFFLTYIQAIDLQNLSGWGMVWPQFQFRCCARKKKFEG